MPQMVCVLAMRSCNWFLTSSLSLLSSGVPRTLDVTEFAEVKRHSFSQHAVVVSPLTHVQARTHEIRELKQAIQDLGGSHRIFQKLPRHLRRRTMSHNVHRLPARLRGAAKREVCNFSPHTVCSSDTFLPTLSNCPAPLLFLFSLPLSQGLRSENPPGNAIPPKRREKRRPKFTLEAHARRQMKHTWLETHIWHAKRMHMRNFWGYKLVSGE